MDIDTDFLVHEGATSDGYIYDAQTFFRPHKRISYKESEMITKFLNGLEDPRRPFLGPNYWIMRKMGLILPENKFGKGAYIFIHAFVTIFVFTQYMELFVIKSNLDLVLTNLKISMLSIVCVVKANTFVFWQSNWRELIDYISKADIFERENKDPIRARVIDSYTRYCRRVIYFYWILVCMTVITVINTPLLRYLSSSMYREALQNGTEPFPHIFSAWVPFDKYSGLGYWVTILYHIALCAYGGGIMAAYDSSVVVIMVFFGGKLDLLRERCRQIFGTDDRGVSEIQASTTIKELHGIHTLLMKNSKLFNSMLSPVMFFYVIMCSSMLCFSAFQLTSATNTTQKLLMAEYLVFGIAQLFMFCWHSNDVIVKSGNAMLGPYESEWWTAGLRQRRKVMLLSGQLTRVHTFTAGPFTDLTLSTFITILKGAYSYYTLLRK